ncbi:MAG: 3-hydroxybutyrate dehydrogenase [Alphaproteobacteria bacterium]|nr:MAG: 3-hydroxybutyrate dehydrogenase [Alphaproteobacteria bacterium]
MSLRGKVAVVTGSTSGIGLGIARALAREGADIVLNGFGAPDAIDDLQRSLSKSCDIRVAYSDADMSKPPAISQMIDRATHELGAVDILVNNAGIQFTAPVRDFPPEKWEAILAINLSAAFYATKAVLPSMLTSDWGRIINIASTHGLVASAEKAAYVAAKHGVIGFTKVVALETAKSGVTCNAICPGWVLTPLVEKQIADRAKGEKISTEDAKVELLAEKQPSQEFATPEQLGALAVFLCSDAAAQMRGAALPVDGGWLAQ